MATDRIEALLLEAELVGIATSHCLHPVGAIVVKGDEIIGRGSNQVLVGTPCNKQGFCSNTQADCTQNLHPSRTVHAEINAITNALESGYSVVGSTVYISQKPCINCLKFLVHTGVEKAFYKDKKDSVKFEDSKLYRDLAEEVNLTGV